jgi:Protein of unknown function (DUF3570)
VQLSRTLYPAALAAGLCAAWTAPCGAALAFDDQNVETTLRTFTDSDHVAVRSYIGSYTLALRNQWALDLEYNNERVVIPGVAAPAGSQQAVDAITTASRPISGNAYTDFVKVRNEVQSGVTHGGAALNYYVSTESDYLGQQLAASYNRDFHNQQLNLSFGSSYGWDAIDPLADDDTQTGKSHKNTLHWNAVATQVVTSTTMMRLGVEYNIVEGLQHNPYRNVYAGGTNVAEHHPNERQRRDVFFKVHQYLSNRSSLKFGYRFYDDDWGIHSHEFDTRLSQYVTQGVFARFQHRYYTQSSADFYREEYLTTTGINGYLTGDYRLGPLSSHLFGVGLDFDLYGIAADSPVWSRMALRMNYERYFNSNNYSAGFFTTGLDYRF